MGETPSDSAPLSYADKLRAAKNPECEGTEANSAEQSNKPVKNLVIDTGALIHYVQLHDLADNFYAPPDVMREMKSQRSKIKLTMLPFEIIWREPSAEAFRKVSEEAKKTGDIRALSLPDLKVLALTWDLSQQFGCCGKEGTGVAATENLTVEQVEAKLNDLELKGKDDDNKAAGDSGVQPPKVHTTGVMPDGWCTGDVDSDDEEGWIHAGNITDTLSKLGAVEVEEGITVGCITTDFALQNVLLTMELNLVSLAGYRVTKLRSWVLRCRACYSTTANMEREFCSKCGNKAMHRCPIIVNENGEQVMHVSMKVLRNTRFLGKLPGHAKGGRNVYVEKTVEDQRVPRLGVSRGKQDPLHDGPFALHDVDSRSSYLGIGQLAKKGTRNNPGRRNELQNLRKLLGNKLKRNTGRFLKHIVDN